MDRIYYVYLHIRPDTGACFYVGKGKGIRAHDMRRGRNCWHKSVTKKLSELGMCAEVQLVGDCLTEREAFDLEIEQIALWRSEGAPLTNLTDGGDGPSGRKHTEEWKRANSERMKGREVSEETRARIAAAHKGNSYALGYKKTPEQIEKSSTANRGKKRSDETKTLLREIRLANPTFKGRQHTDEARRAISEAHVGMTHSAEAKAKMRKPKSDEARKNMSIAKTGRRMTDEQRAKHSERVKAQWANRKAAITEVEN